MLLNFVILRSFHLFPLFSLVGLLITRAARRLPWPDLCHRREDGLVKPSSGNAVLCPFCFFLCSQLIKAAFAEGIISCGINCDNFWYDWTCEISSVCLWCALTWFNFTTIYVKNGDLPMMVWKGYMQIVLYSAQVCLLNYRWHFLNQVWE